MRSCQSDRIWVLIRLAQALGWLHDPTCVQHLRLSNSDTSAFICLILVQVIKSFYLYMY